jgi:hypothetical protein
MRHGEACAVRVPPERPNVPVSRVVQHVDHHEAPRSWWASLPRIRCERVAPPHR